MIPLYPEDKDYMRIYNLHLFMFSNTIEWSEIIKKPATLYIATEKITEALIAYCMENEIEIIELLHRK